MLEGVVGGSVQGKISHLSLIYNYHIGNQNTCQ